MKEDVNCTKELEEASGKNTLDKNVDERYNHSTSVGGFYVRSHFKEDGSKDIAERIITTLKSCYIKECAEKLGGNV